MSGNVYHNSFFAMGTRLNALLLHEDEEVCERIFNLMHEEVLRLENKLSCFLPESDIPRINKFAFRKEVDLDDEIFSILKICDEYNEITGGAFDITMRSRIEAYNLPCETGNISWKNSVILSGRKTIRFTDEKVKIDLGAFGKGYALENIRRIADASPVKDLFISFGESSILTKGKHPAGDVWKVGINDLFNSGAPAYLFELNNASISTSSNYRIDDSGQLSMKLNVIDPFTGRNFSGLSSVTVYSDIPLQAEILSTAFLVMEEDRIRKTKENFRNIKAVRIKYDSPDRIIVY